MPLFFIQLPSVPLHPVAFFAAPLMQPLSASALWSPHRRSLPLLIDGSCRSSCSAIFSHDASCPPPIHDSECSTFAILVADIHAAADSSSVPFAASALAPTLLLHCPEIFALLLAFGSACLCGSLVDDSACATIQMAELVASLQLLRWRPRKLSTSIAMPRSCSCGINRVRP